MNKFDRAVNRKTSELILKNLIGQEVYEDDLRNLRPLQEQWSEKN